MLNRPVTVFVLAGAFAISAPARLHATDNPADEQVIVLPDEGIELDSEDSTPLLLHVDREHGRGYIGLNLIEITPALREHFGVSKDTGVMVGGVEPDSPASKAGIQVADIVTAVDGARVDSASDLSRAVRRRKAGETVTLDLSRDRAKKQLKVSVADRPAREIRVGDLTPRMGRHWVYPHGDWETPIAGPLEDLGRLQERMKEIEKRLKDLEKKFPSK